MIKTYVIDELKRTIAPEEAEKYPSVVIGDDSINGIEFEFPNVFEHFDLYNGVKHIIYIKPDGEKKVKLLTETSEETGRYLWRFDDGINHGDPGVISFAMMIDKVDDEGTILKTWVSLPASFNAEKSLGDERRDDADEEEIYSERLAAAETNIANLRQLVSALSSGTPTTADTETELEDPDRIYVVTFTDEYYVAGDWYYHNGERWVSGGQYGALPAGGVRTDALADGAVTVAKLAEDAKKLIKESGLAFDGGYQDGNGYIHLTEDGEDIEGFTPFEIKSGGGLSFDTGYQDENGYVHLTKNGEDIEGFDPFPIAGGGGDGSGSKLTFGVYTPSVFSVMSSSGEAVISYKFASIDTETKTPTGNGTMAVIVGETTKANLVIAQGDNLTIDVFPYLAEGANAVRLVITDSYGATATRSFTISVETFKLEWSLSNVNKNTEPSLSFYVTPTGSGEKTIYTYVDGTLTATDTVTTSGRRLTKTITGLSHGAHTIEIYGTMTVDGSPLESNHLTAAVAQITAGSTTPVIAARWPSGTLAQYTAFKVEYAVVDPANNPTTVTLLVGGAVVQTLTVDQSAQTWTYRPMASGNLTFTIACGSTSVTKQLSIAPIGGDIAEITDGLQIKLDPSAVSDLATWTYGSYSLSLSDGFDLINGGVQVDSDGVPCIRITAGDRLTLNYAPFFGSDAKRNGKSLKVIYKIADCSSKTAVGVSCMSGGIGFTCQANKVLLSGDQTTAELSVCEDLKNELDITIQQDSDDMLMHIWESCSTFAYKQYAASESFSQPASTGVIFGSDDADVYLYLFRGYSRDLTDAERLANYVADGPTGDQILARSERNNIYDSSGQIDVNRVVELCPNADVYRIDAERMTTGKKDYVFGRLRHWQGASDYHKWTADVRMSIQGTSSVEHAATAGGNLNFVLSNIVCDDGTHLEGWAFNGPENSIPTTMINFKKNIASEDHIVNIAVAEWYNRYQQSIRAARSADPRVRDCLEGKMAIVFFRNTGSQTVMVGPDTVQPGETVFFGLGNSCSNKDAEEIFSYDPIVIEVKNNTEPQVRFKSDDLSGDKFSNNYEFRYLDESAYTEAAAQALWQEVQTFVYETDYTAATNTALSPAKTINGQVFTVDSAAYRKARWTAEAPDHFDMATLYFHHNITLLMLLRDNRAKNMFWSYNATSGKWGLWFNWDNDTGLCRNNEGYIDIEPGYMDFDTIGTSDVFNGADNAIFLNLRECNWPALQSSYLAMESAGATDIDAIYAWMMTRQSYICEALWIEDAEHNAIRVMQILGSTGYLGRATGRMRTHLYKALLFQKALVDSYYVSTACTSGSAALRGYTPSTWTGVRPSGLISITPYTNLYINILVGSTAYKVRAYEGAAATVDISAALNDTEFYLRSAEWIQSMGDLSALYLGQFEAANLKRVRTLLIGSEVEGYNNTNFYSISVGNCKLLKTLCLGGLVNAAQAFDFSGNIYLDYIYTKGSGVTGISFAKNGKLTEAHLNALSSLTMKGLNFLETFEMESFAGLTSLTIEDSPAADSYGMASAAANLARVRLIEIDWSVDVAAYDVLMRLKSIYGIDDDGYSVEGGVITGSCYFRTITQSKYDRVSAALPGVTFTYGELLQEVTITFKNDDGTVLYVTTTERGGRVTDPVTAGIIPTPTKDSTVTTVYTYYNWDCSLDYFTADTVVTAIFSESARTYTVRFLDYDDTVLETVTEVAVYSGVTYSGEDLDRQGYIWTGWDTDTSSVTADLDVKAVYDYPQLPAANHYDDMADYDYAYSDDSSDRSAYTFGELYAILKTGRASAYLPIGSLVKVKWETTVITDDYSILALHAYGHYELADGSGVGTDVMSNADFYMTHTLIANRTMNGSNTNTGGWDSSSMRTWLNGTLYREMPSHWRQLIARSITLTSAGARSSTITESADYLRLMSHAEAGFDPTATPYKDEIDSRAAEVTFSFCAGNAARTKKNYYGTGTAQDWWLRSPDSGSTTYFRNVRYTGGASANNASPSNAVSFGFST